MAADTPVTLAPIFSEPSPESGSQPFLIGSLLTLDGTRVLLDCGWTEAFDAEAVLCPLRRLAPTLDAVLVSFGDLLHVGALPLLYRASALGGAGCSARAYMTPPVASLGKLSLQDAHACRCREDAGWEAGAFSLEDLSTAFKLPEFGGPVVQVRFAEESALGAFGVLATAYAAGHALGGALWRIVKGAESVVYAPRLHHRGELHLPRALLAGHGLRTPTALIVDGGHGGLELLDARGLVVGGSGGARAAAQPRPAAPAPDLSAWALPPPPRLLSAPGAAAADRERSRKDAWQAGLVEACVAIMRKGGSVLLPTDTAGRGLEVLLRLDSAYGMRGAWPIFYLSSVAPEVRVCGVCAAGREGVFYPCFCFCPPPMLNKQHATCSLRARSTPSLLHGRRF